MSRRFTKGDHIEVKANGSTIRGTAMTTRETLGWADFVVMLSDGQKLRFNLNHVEVENLFRADVAREMSPDDPEAEGQF